MECHPQREREIGRGREIDRGRERERESIDLIDRHI